MHTIADKKLLMLRPSDIIASGHTPRQFFDPDELRLLADSIAVNGVIHPLAVRKNQKGGYYLITGERRLRAAKMAGLRRIPCILHKVDDETADFYAVVENLQHSDLNMFEEADFVNSLIFEHGLSQSEVSVRLGITQSALSAMLKLLRLDTATRKKVSEYNLSARQARSLLRIPESRRNETAEIIAQKGLNNEQTDRFITELLNSKAAAPEKSEKNKRQSISEVSSQSKKASIGDIRLFANSLYKLTETLSTAGINTGLKTTETAKYIEYKIRVEKSGIEPQKQLKIC